MDETNTKILRFLDEEGKVLARKKHTVQTMNQMSELLYLRAIIQTIIAEESHD